MRIPSWILVAGSVLLALPVGWGLGVLVAYAIAGSNFGQLPALTVPVSIIAAIIFALSPATTPQTRLAIMAAATGAFILLGMITG